MKVRYQTRPFTYILYADVVLVRKTALLWGLMLIFFLGLEFSMSETTVSNMNYRCFRLPV